jgi:predicted metal-binding membrane protein
MWKAQSNGLAFSATLVGLVALAWVALVLLDTTPYGALLNHDELGRTRLVLDAEYGRTALVFVLGWALMTVAMMLPTSLPLILLFRTMMRRRATLGLLTALLLAGYLAVWLAFGAAAHFADFWVHRSVEASATLHANSWVIAAAVLLIAGAYQFTPLKYVCLDKCRSPYSFIVEHWRGGNEAMQALRIGVHHGVFCVGCCWSLMLLMFAVGVGNLLWMLALAVVMGVEKNLPWGRRLSAPLGSCC